MVLENRYLNKKGLSDYLGISIGKVEKMMYDDGLRYVKFGRNVRFDLDDVNEYMNKYKVS
tara:strand:- start:184 stop:363 length:180 start_codon:yes stop_codon:yes gene_type:complete